MLVPAYLNMPKDDEILMTKAWTTLKKFKVLNAALELQPKTAAFVPPEEMECLHLAVKVLKQKNYGRITWDGEIEWFSQKEVEMITLGTALKKETMGLFYESGNSSVESSSSDEDKEDKFTWSDEESGNHQNILEEGREKP